MAFSIPKKSVKKDFEIRLAEEDGGDVYRIPLIENLPLKFLEPLQEAANAMQSKRRREQEKASVLLLKAVVSILDHYAPGVSELMDTETLQAFFDAWQEASEGDLGES